MRYNEYSLKRLEKKYVRSKIDIAFGRALRQQRAIRGLSQEGMADLCGMDRTYVSLLERGRRSPTIRTVHQLCNSLKLRPSEFFAHVEKFLD
jgi:transcriptional regulator with XRE-family HTH domain